MNKIVLSYILRLLLFTLITGIASFIVYSLIPSDFYTSTFPYLLLLFFLVTLTGRIILIKASEGNNPASFTRWFMAASFIKLFIYIIIMFVYALNFKDDAKNFIVSYFILYVLYTGFEVIEITSAYKRK